MDQSHVIEVNGVFVGAAVRMAEGFRFVAVDLRVGGLDGRMAGTLAETRRLACSTYHQSGDHTAAAQPSEASRGAGPRGDGAQRGSAQGSAPRGGRSEGGRSDGGRSEGRGS